MYRLKEVSSGYVLQARFLFFFWRDTIMSYSSLRDGIDAMKMLTCGTEAKDYHYLD